jgi:hypothetical protein
MKPLRGINPTDEQHAILVDRHNPCVIKGALGSGKTTTAVIRLQFVIRILLREYRRRMEDNAGLIRVINVLVLTFNNTLKGYVSALIDSQINLAKEYNYNIPIDLEVYTYHKWAKVAVGRGGQINYKSHLETIVRKYAAQTRFTEGFLHDEVDYCTGRFLAEEISHYIGAVRVGRGKKPKFEGVDRKAFVENVASSEEFVGHWRFW